MDRVERIPIGVPSYKKTKRDQNVQIPMYHQIYHLTYQEVNNLQTLRQTLLLDCWTYKALNSAHKMELCDFNPNDIRTEDTVDIIISITFTQLQV